MVFFTVKKYSSVLRQYFWQWYCSSVLLEISVVRIFDVGLVVFGDSGHLVVFWS